MEQLVQLTIVGLVAGCVYALSATGLVVTYTTSGIFNFAHGAIGMLGAFTYWQLTVGWHWPAILAALRGRARSSSDSVIRSKVRA